MKFSEIESYPIWSNNGNNEYNKIQREIIVEWDERSRKTKAGYGRNTNAFAKGQKEQ